MFLSMVILALAIPASAGVVKEFDASAGSPGAQGWSQVSGVLSGGTTTALGETVWEMTGTWCCGYYYTGLTPEQWTDAFTLGWSLAGRARVGEGDAHAYMILLAPDTLSNRWDITFGVTGGKGWAGLAVFTDSADPALKYTLSDNDFHDIEMKYDPASKTASLLIDGVKKLDGYKGHNNFATGAGPAFGTGGFGATKAQFESVRFSIAYPVVDDPGADPSEVPEPSAWMLAATGIVLAAGRLATRRSC
jgi:hypothetical protein